MISFHVPLSSKEDGGKTKEFFSFAVAQGSTVLFAGSRHQEISQQVCRDLIGGFGRLAFSFIVGDANGVDMSFRSALAESDYSAKTFVAVCYPYRVPKISDLTCNLVVPDTVHPRQAPRVRTLYMVDRCSMAVVFADDVKSCSWGKGSTVCINACVRLDKPIFVVTSYRPEAFDTHYVLPTSLFGAVRGYFVVPKRAGKIIRSSFLKKEVA